MSSGSWLAVRKDHQPSALDSEKFSSYFYCFLSFGSNLIWVLFWPLSLEGEWKTFPPISRNFHGELHCPLPSALGLARLWLIRTTLLFICLTRRCVQCVPGEWDFSKELAVLSNPPCLWNPATWSRGSVGSKHRCFMLLCLPLPKHQHLLDVRVKWFLGQSPNSGLNEAVMYGG